jgi:8-oxo-dGTP diphosphatase
VRREDEVLLVLRRGAHGEGTWSSPGGNLDFGEDPAVCAAREVKEETGVDIGVPRFVGLTNDVFEADGKHYVTLWFEADYASGDPDVRAEDELADVVWFSREQLPAPLFLPLENLLEGRTLQ